MRIQPAAVAFLIVAIFASLTQAQNAKKRPSRPPGKGFRRPDNLQRGDVAPNFTLKSPDGKRLVKLSDFRSKKPVALVFGSYT